MVISKTTVKELEKIQHLISSFILQLPQSSSQVMGWMEAGLQPIQQRLDTRTVLYAHSLMTGKKDQLTKAVLGTTLADAADPWTKSLHTILEKVGIHDLGGSSRRAVRKQMREYHVSQIRQSKTEHTSLRWLTEPKEWFKLQPHINDSEQCRTLSRTRAGDTGLGNRRPNHLGITCKKCSWCSAVGIDVQLDELHVILNCPGSGHARRASGIYAFVEARLSVMTETDIMIEFLGGDSADVDTMMTRGKWIMTVLEEWNLAIAQL